VVADLYEVREMLGAGGMGTVFRVHHRGWGLDLAVKCPQARLLRAAGGREAFEREAETWVNLELHPNIVTCYYVRRIDTIPTLFAELVNGGSLQEAIADGRTASLERVVDLAIQIAWGLEAAHSANLVHRDVKPANVMLSSDGTAKVTDFGLAVMRAAAVDGRGPDSVPIAGGGGGTPAYCSPEQAAGAPLGRRTDVYSFAGCVVEMLRGERTWEYGPAIGEALRDMASSGSFAVANPPERLVSLLMSCLATDPQERPADLATVAEQLTEILHAATGQPYGRARPKLGRRRADTLNNRAVSLLDLGRGRDAEGYWERSLEIAPNHPESTYNLAAERWLRGRLSDEALEQSVARLDPSPVTHGLQARVQLALGAFERAIELLENATDSEMAADAATALAGLAVERPGDDEVVQAAAARLAELTAGQASSLRLRAAARAVASLARGDGLDRSAAASAGLTPAGSVLATGATLTAIATTPEHAVAASGNQIVCWRHAAPAERRSIGAVGERIRALAIVDESTALIASDGVLLQRLDLHTGRTRPAAPHLPGYIIDVAVSEDGARAVLGSSDRCLRALDIQTGTCSHTVEAHDGSLAAVALVANGRLAVSGGRDATLRVWDLSTGQCLRTIDTDRQPVHALAASSSGELAATAGADGIIRLWALRNGASAGRLAGHNGQVLALAIADERFLISGGLDRRVRVWNLTTSRVHSVWSGDSAVRAVHADGPDVVAAVGARLVHLGLLEREPVQLAKALSTPVSSDQASAQEATYRQHVAAARRHVNRGQWQEAAEQIAAARAVGGFERDSAAIELWATVVRRFPRADLRSIWLLRSQDQLPVPATAVAADPEMIHLGHSDGAVTVWGPRMVTSRHRLEGHKAPVTALEIARSWALSASLDGTVRVWDPRSGAGLAVLDGHSDQVLCLATDPLSARAASGSADATVILWGVPTHGWLHTFEGHDGAVTSVAFTADGSQLVSVGWDGTIRLWDTASGRALASWRAHSGALTAVRVTPDNRSVVTASADGVVCLWEPVSQRRLRRLEGHSDAVTALEVTPDGRFLVSVSRDESIRVWDLRTGRCSGQLAAHTGGVVDAALRSSGTQLITVGSEGPVHLWQLDWEAELHPVTGWHEAARPFVEVHLARRGSAASSGEEATAANELDGAELRALMNELEGHGFGWLEPQGIQARLASLSSSQASRVSGGAAGRGHPQPIGRRRSAWRRWFTDHPRLAAVLLAVALLAGSTLGPRLLDDSPRLYEHEIDAVRHELRGFYIRLQPFAAVNYACSSKATEQYLNQLREPDYENPQTYERAVTCLMQVRDPAIVTEVIRLVVSWSETEARTERSVLSSTWDLAGVCAARHSAAIPELAPLVTEPRRALRVLALTALSWIADERAGEAMLPALESSDPDVRSDAARQLREAIAIGAVAPDTGLEIAIELLGDPSPDIRRWTVRALPLFDAPEARDAAAAAVTDSDEDVAHAAKQAVRRLRELERRANEAN
jgi:WD40 repeat protein/serine/threonine protein kinase